MASKLCDPDILGSSSSSHSFLDYLAGSSFVNEFPELRASSFRDDDEVPYPFTGWAGWQPGASFLVRLLGGLSTLFLLLAYMNDPCLTASLQNISHNISSNLDMHYLSFARLDLAVQSFGVYYGQRNDSKGEQGRTESLTVSSSDDPLHQLVSEPGACEDDTCKKDFRIPDPGKKKRKASKASKTKICHSMPFSSYTFPIYNAKGHFRLKMLRIIRIHVPKPPPLPPDQTDSVEVTPISSGAPRAPASSDPVDSSHCSCSDRDKYRSHDQDRDKDRSLLLLRMANPDFASTLTRDQIRDLSATALPNLMPFYSLYPVEELLANIHVSNGLIAPPLISTQPAATLSTEKIVKVFDLVSYLLPFLSSLDPSLIFEVGFNLLSLAHVTGGKPEWVSTSIITMLTLWDRHEFSLARESIVLVFVNTLHLLDLSLQGSLFKRFLLRARNLRAESNIKHALTSICHAVIGVDLLVMQVLKQGEVQHWSPHPIPFQHQPLSPCKHYAEVHYAKESLRRESALEVVEVCRPCVMWDCDGKTYTIDCYLKLLVRLCYIYDTIGGASQDQILNETRLRNLQLQQLKDLCAVNTPRIFARLICSIAEHFDLEGLNPPLVDDLEDPLIFSSDAINSNRLQDVQVVLLYVQRLGSRNARAGQLLISTHGGMQNCGRYKVFMHLMNKLADMHRRRKIFDPGGLIINSTSISLSTTRLDGVELF
ncbi:Protein TPLATE [Dendrobium catenatum]|uniref:Protein TPLATE n=1 Tax=Dendrobium catenatum TaxID=906689 RepID=A0A2I0V750_9ASPA|nr:Protein TPLATE [Dendrobium catenatum]